MSASNLTSLQLRVGGIANERVDHRGRLDDDHDASRVLRISATVSATPGALRPGGVLAAVAVPRRDLPRELPVELAATAWHHLIGLSLAVGGDRTRVGVRRRHDLHYDDMPVHAPNLTTRQVREQACAVLPGVDVRRLLLWRYLLTWRRPTAPHERSPQ